jgi:hypothetical protein
MLQYTFKKIMWFETSFLQRNIQTNLSYDCIIIATLGDRFEVVTAMKTQFYLENGIVCPFNICSHPPNYNTMSLLRMPQYEASSM